MKFTKVFLGLLFGIFLIANASAVSVSWGQWAGGSTSTTITQGQSTSFNYYFYDLSNPQSSMSMTIKLYTSSGKLVHTFLDTSTTSSYYNSNSVQITSQIYKSPGNYYLTFYSNDVSNNPSIQTIYLTVKSSLPTPPPITNSPPVLNSILNQQANESSSYSYQVSASDPDGDTLTYSLLQSPSWLSINSSTGLISGTTANVSVDKSYTIKVGVSDGVNLQVTTSYTLIVNHVAVYPKDTTAPSIWFMSPTPLNNSVLNQSYIPVYVIVSDPMPGTGVKNTTIYLYDSLGLVESHNSSGFFNFTSLTDGVYYINATAYDFAGNSNSTGTLKIILNSSSSPTPQNQTNYISGYSYYDVYTPQYQKQINQTGSKINPGETSSISSTGTFWIWFLLVAILILLIGGVSFFLREQLIKEKKNGNKENIRE